MSRSDFIRNTAQYIARVQQPSGAVPWFPGGTLDPWDHVEAAMGLSVAGYLDEAEAAYWWLAGHQRDDGSWLAAYDGEAIADGTRAETNFVAYVATGVWHHYLISENRRFLADMWPTIERAMDFVLSLQAPSGEIYWALDTRTGINKDALITGCSSIYKSLECAINTAAALGEDARHLAAARSDLGAALRCRPERFDRTWESKSRYSMDWFYPVMTGVLEGEAARLHLAQRWNTFVEPELGCRCVADQNWVTVAESCELILACLATRATGPAGDMFAKLARYQAEDGSWWTGYAFDDDVMWPDERPTWTAGAVLLAADALTSLTRASRLFTTVSLPDSVQHSQSVGRLQGLK